jgi:TM2 domain-containing membrane protein YozV
MKRRKSRLIAAALAFFGGSLGIHKFYLDKVGPGFFYLFLTFVIFSGVKFPFTFLLGLMDAVKLLSMNDKVFDEEYNQGQHRASERDRSGRRIERENNKSSKEIEKMESKRKRYNYSKSKSANPFIKSGDRKYKEYDLIGAAKDFTQALELNPDDVDVNFKLAAVHSLMENKEKSFYYLEESIRLGYKDYEKIKSIDDLAYLRIQPEYENFVSRGYKRDTALNIESPKQDLLADDALLSQFNKLKDLRDRGLLSDKEYAYEKEKLSRR